MLGGRQAVDLGHAVVDAHVAELEVVDGEPDRGALEDRVEQAVGLVELALGGLGLRHQAGVVDGGGAAAGQLLGERAIVGAETPQRAVDPELERAEAGAAGPSGITSSPRETSGGAPATTRASACSTAGGGVRGIATARSGAPPGAVRSIVQRSATAGTAAAATARSLAAGSCAVPSSSTTSASRPARAAAASRRVRASAAPQASTPITATVKTKTAPLVVSISSNVVRDVAATASAATATTAVVRRPEPSDATSGATP